ncbi:hypothetical protein DMN91_006734 [Ooceraea biroi]|uniref:Uncharacterized protein n=1 Tax=Ooceraea biroi TaxID=2015173 RepID=A0A3L8DJT9_OOCBI|nr:hypothetical protein DMN91_006734 [Ooceraea biroi]
MDNNEVYCRLMRACAPAFHSDGIKLSARVSKGRAMSRNFTYGRNTQYRDREYRQEDFHKRCSLSLAAKLEKLPAVTRDLLIADKIATRDAVAHERCNATALKLQRGLDLMSSGISWQTVLLAMHY